MEFLLVLILGVGLVWWFRALRKRGRVRTDPAHQTQTDDGETFVCREGKHIAADEVFWARASGDLARMESAVELETNRIDRHFLLLQLCKETYRQRNDPSMRMRFLKYARQHMTEFPELASSLKMEFDGILPRVPTFQQLATVLTEDGEFDEAIRVCERAQAFGLVDGTKAGFEGRIARIQKKHQRTQKRRGMI
jgi:hypothetical protein